MAAPAAGDPDELPLDVALIKVLASDSRRDILRLLGERRKTLTELADAMGLKKATVIEHLQKLVASGLIRRLDEGDRLWIYYELTPRGVRLVRPSRTRFYLLLAGTAAAAVLLGAVVAVAYFTGGPALQSDEAGATEPYFDAREPPVSPIAWRGLDTLVPIELPASTPANGTLVLTHPQGARTTLELRDHRAQLDAVALDALAAGAYAFSLETDAGALPIPGALDVRHPPIAVFPRVVPANVSVAFQVALVPPGLGVPPAPRVFLADEEARVETLAHELRVDAPPLAPGEVVMRIGRIDAALVRVLPDLPVEALHDNGTMRLHTGAAHAQVALDGATFGTTDEAGLLVAPWPAEGPHTIGITQADGEGRTFAFYFSQSAAGPLAPQLRIEPVDARFGSPELRIRADVYNDGPAPEYVTIAVRDGATLLASAPVEVPASGRAEVLLEAPIPQPARVEVEAYAARAEVTSIRFYDAYDADADANSETDALAGAPPAAPAGEHAGKSFAAYNASAWAVGGPDARATLGLIAPEGRTTPTTAPTPHDEPAARVPGPTPILLAAAILAGAFLARKKR